VTGTSDRRKAGRQATPVAECHGPVDLELGQMHPWVFRILPEYPGVQPQRLFCVTTNEASGTEIPIANVVRMGLQKLPISVPDRLQLID